MNICISCHPVMCLKRSEKNKLYLFNDDMSFKIEKVITYNTDIEDQYYRCDKTLLYDICEISEAVNNDNYSKIEVIMYNITEYKILCGVFTMELGNEIVEYDDLEKYVFNGLFTIMNGKEIFIDSVDTLVQLLE